MKRKSVFLIAAGVIAAHAVAFYFVAGMNPLPKVPFVPPPNLNLGWAKFTDPATHDNMVYQEFTVSARVEKSAPATSPNVPPPQ